MANWNLLVENYFSKKDILTLDKIDDLVLEVLKESTTLYEASKRGVAHDDKMGKEIVNQKGDKLVLSDFAFIQIGQDGVEDAEALGRKVEDIISSAGMEVLYQHPEVPTRSHKAAILVSAADDSDKKFAFVKYTSSSSLWREVDFEKATGFSMKGTQSSKEILALGPQTLIGTDAEITITNLPTVVAKNASASSAIPAPFTESLGVFFDNVYSKSGDAVLAFESSEQRDNSLSSVNKYFGEIMAPALLGINYKLQPDAVILDAQKNLLEPFGLTWADSTAVSYPQAPQNPLVDSYLHLGDRKIGVSSKSGKGANPSVKNLYSMIFDEASEEQRQQLREAGYGDYVDLVKLLTESSSKLGPIRAAVKLGILTEAAAQEAVDVIKNKIGVQEVNVSDELEKISSFHTPLRRMKLGVNQVKSLDSDAQSKIVKTYSPANHLVAGIAKAVAAQINAEESAQGGGKKFTAFGKAVFNFSTMVQIYGKFSKAGEAATVMNDFRIIYPPNFDGEMLLDAGKGYTSSGQNDKLTVKLK